MDGHVHTFSATQKSRKQSALCQVSRWNRQADTCWRWRNWLKGKGDSLAFSLVSPYRLQHPLSPICFKLHTLTSSVHRDKHTHARVHSCVQYIRITLIAHFFSFVTYYCGKQVLLMRTGINIAFISQQVARVTFFMVMTYLNNVAKEQNIIIIGKRQSEPFSVYCKIIQLKATCWFPGRRRSANRSSTDLWYLKKQ